MFAHKKNYGRAGYVDDPLPNIVYMAIWMPACIVWLYYATIYHTLVKLTKVESDVREKSSLKFNNGTNAEEATEAR